MTEFLSQEVFDERLTEGPWPTAVLFVTSWCPHCVEAKEVFDQLGRTLDDVDLFMVDAEEEWELSERFNITQVPTCMIFAPGSVEPTVITGTVEEGTISALLDSLRKGVGTGPATPSTVDVVTVALRTDSGG